MLFKHSLTQSLCLAAGLASVVSLVACSSSSTSTPDPTGGAGGGSQTLFQKYGGKPTVVKVVDDAVTGVLADPVEMPFFGVIGMTGHDSATRLKSCLVLQFSALMGDPSSTYPGKNDNGDMCEDMKTAHTGLGITGPVFDQFIMDLGGVLKKDGVSDADIAMMVPALTGMKADIAQGAGAGGAGGAGGGSGAGGGGGSTGTQSLFDKYGGKPTVVKVVDDAVTGVLADPVEMPFFGVIGMTGHDSATRLKSCLVLQFSALMGDPNSKYPGMNDNGDMCMDMKTTHAGLNITGPVFDQFIMDLGGVLKKDGVSDADIAMMVPALTGMKTDIVTK